MIPSAEVTYSQGVSILEKELPTIPDDYFFTFEGEPGVKAEYYRGFNIKGNPDLTRIENSPNIKWEFHGTPDSTIFKPTPFQLGSLEI